MVVLQDGFVKGRRTTHVPRDVTWNQKRYGRPSSGLSWLQPTFLLANICTPLPASQTMQKTEREGIDNPLSLWELMYCLSYYSFFMRCTVRDFYENVVFVLSIFRAGSCILRYYYTMVCTEYPLPIHSLSHINRFISIIPLPPTPRHFPSLLTSVTCNTEGGFLLILVDFKDD
jgi:hypothetical protein